METLQRLHNRGSISTGPYQIDNSLKFDSGNSEYLYITRDTSGSDWNRLKWTASMWVKHIPTESSATAPKERMFGASDTQSDFDIRFRGQPLGFRNNSDVDGVGELRTTAVFRDYSAWMHVVAVWDTANATAGNRMRLYVNGEEITDFSTDTQPSQNEKSIWGKKNDGTDGNVVHAIGCQVNASTGFTQGFNGYMAEIHWVEGEALAPTDFGEFDEDSAIWIPKQYTGSYGTNGFYLDFSNSGSLGADASGNGNNWTLNNIAAADQSTDTPTNNFCIMNVNSRTNSDITTSQGGTKVANSGSSICSMNGSIGVSSGKWYWECRFANDPGNTNTVFVGIAAANDPYVPHNSNNYLGQESGYGSIGWYFVNGGIYNGTGTWTGPGYGNIIMFALDMDNLKLYFGKEGTWQNSSDPAGNSNGISIATSFTNLTGGTDIILPAVSISGGDNMDSMNFGGFANYTQSSAASDANGYGTFEYSPPSGFYALCTKNLAEYG